MTIGTFEAKQNFSSLMQRVAGGEIVTITKRGVPVARIMPVAADAPLTAEEAVQRMLDFPKATLGAGLSIKQLIEEGRRF
ncbi:hypothetical protein CCAX7_008900 [Capsulimonas corticalis]|uniref:Antitoxin n=1 Tax=Capsulimonas corticalis TaxID=2219043 RepID=A0A402CU39_9BACT|nr:type II toxin-antitoxin system prevent-host-death family antitoxin [Capsulimonas corticalis]BDI28839.1 hypothetical protein CCAX7_008900 [Capsulimonas corticalis]